MYEYIIFGCSTGDEKVNNELFTISSAKIHGTVAPIDVFRFHTNALRDHRHLFT